MKKKEKKTGVSPSMLQLSRRLIFFFFFLFDFYSSILSLFLHFFFVMIKFEKEKKLNKNKILYKKKKFNDCENFGKITHSYQTEKKNDLLSKTKKMKRKKCKRF
jgi:hypothetical protein